VTELPDGKSAQGAIANAPGRYATRLRTSGSSATRSTETRRSSRTEMRSKNRGASLIPSSTTRRRCTRTRRARGGPPRASGSCLRAALGPQPAEPALRGGSRRDAAKCARRRSSGHSADVQWRRLPVWGAYFAQARRAARAYHSNAWIALTHTRRVRRPLPRRVRRHPRGWRTAQLRNGEASWSTRGRPKSAGRPPGT
jgi:hypothetical protein